MEEEEAEEVVVPAAGLVAEAAAEVGAELEVEVELEVVGAEAVRRS